MSHPCCDHANEIASRPASAPKPIWSLLADAVRFVERCLAYRRQRQQLLGLDDRTLKDIGLNPADVLREADRPFWDVADRRRGDR